MSDAPHQEYIYGRRPVWEVMRAQKRRVHRLWIVSGTSGDVMDEVLRWAKERSVPLEWMRREQLDRMVRGNHQGIAAQVGATPHLDLDEFLRTLGEKDAVLVGLDEIEDPQ